MFYMYVQWRMITKCIIIREKDRSAKLIIKMQGQMTTIANPETPSEYYTVCRIINAHTYRHLHWYICWRIYLIWTFPEANQITYILLGVKEILVIKFGQFKVRYTTREHVILITCFFYYFRSKTKRICIWLKVKPQNIFEIHKRTLALCLKNKRKKGRSKHEIDSATFTVLLRSW